MIAVVQRVSSASVEVLGETVGRIGAGCLILLGVERGDGEVQAVALAARVATCRMFAADGRGLDASVEEIGGSCLVVSQFTLCADTTKGRRPSFGPAAPPAAAEPLYETFVRALRARGLPVATGRFGATMSVVSRNEGPVTLILTTREPRPPGL